MVDAFHKVAPHAVVRDWLGKQTVKRLLRYAQANEQSFEDSPVYNEDYTLSSKQDLRVSKTFGLGHLRDELKANLIELLPRMADELGVKRFAPSTIKANLVVHGDGAFFIRHADTYRGEGQLWVMNGIYYFHSLPKAFSGGALRLYSLSVEHHVDITPDCDTIIFFPSFFPHEVLPVSCPSRRFLDSRFAVNFMIMRDE